DNSVQDEFIAAATDATTKANAAEANAKLYADQKTKNIASNVDNDTHQFTDEDFNIVARIDSDAQLHLVDLENSVQMEINNQKKTATHVSDIESLLHVFADADDNIVAGIDKSGGLQLVGSTVSLQEKLNWRKVQLPARDFNERDLFVESANKYILNMSVSGNQNAPIPFNLLPQNYTVPDSFVNNYSLNPPTSYLPINTPYGDDDRVVHPYVIEFAGNFRGFRYLMCITPYTVEAHENPVIMGSNDLESWEMLTGFDQPIAAPLPRRFLSDNGFAYDPTSGMLICYWRDGITNSSDDTNIYYRATRDGTEWTDPQLLFAADPTSSNLSPSVLFNPNDGLWHMWIGQSNGYWRHYTSKTLNNNWELKSTRSFLDKGLWHSEVKFLGDKYVMLINKRDPNSNFYFAVSSNGDDWTTGNYLFNIQQDALYKASFLPKFNDAGEMAFDIFYTTNHASDTTWLRKFFHLTTNFAEI
ncbi:hypothetical protein KTI62_15835, partial [Acinetobacter schindleri]|uniref:hypothetical protein n=1 Tax=Acinetobacter schindleri TaxID=108981 RepID=UPI0021CDBD04